MILVNFATSESRLFPPYPSITAIVVHYGFSLQFELTNFRASFVPFMPWLDLFAHSLLLPLHLAPRRPPC